ncbi:MAG: hypothetical protein EXR98_08050 [Gemmataceae bacterium]|nr:hypothetical protein [Gemmataceae bacterium]
MKWANLLRRWTMQSIHAAILGAALTGSASIAIAQATDAAASQSSRHFTKSQTFDLPIKMDAAERLKLQEFRLYMRTPSTPWQLHDRGSATQTKFTCKVPRDGEYWFTLVIVDREGCMDPPDVNLEAPGQRVIVDTVAPVIQVQSWTSPENDMCLRCTVQDANPDHATLKAVCRTDGGDIPLELVPNQPGTFRLKGETLMRFPVVVSVMDLAKNVSTKEVNVREMISSALIPPVPKGRAEVAQTGGNTDPRGIGSLPPPRFDPPPPPPKTDTPSKVVDFVAPPPPLNPGSSSNAGTPPSNVAPPPVKTPALPPETAQPGSAPHQLINTTRAAIDFRIDQVGPSGLGKVEIYMTRDKGQTWHRLSEAADKRSPADVNLPGDGVYGIRIVVTNGNGFGGKAPVRGDAPHCTLEVDTTAPFVQLRSAEVIASSGHVELRWNATDNNFGADPVSLFYRTSPDGAWQVIARGVKNDGVHRWTFPRDAGGQFFFKIEAADRAGNMSQDISRQPVVIDMTEPRATVVGVTGSAAPVLPPSRGQ